jgi:hypothetical protein
LEGSLNKFFIVSLGALVFVLAFSACGSIPLVSQNVATETPTRRAARPTFTPKARVTPTEEVEPTQEPTESDAVEPTEQVEPTDVPATEPPTRRPVTPRPTTPPQPTAPPAPQFAIAATDKFLCPQEGIFEVVVSVKRDKVLVEGVAFAAFDAGGTLLQDGAGQKLVSSTYPVSVSTAGNCKISGSFENPVVNNGKLDVVDPVRSGTGTVIIRFVKSEADLTPISADIPIDFGTGGRYWIYTQFR